MINFVIMQFYLLSLNPQDLMYLFVTCMVALIGFFLIRFYYLVDELRRDIKKILQEDAARGVMIKDLYNDMEEMKKEQRDQARTLGELKGQLSRIERRRS